jgi:hypothetical protein
MILFQPESRKSSNKFPHREACLASLKYSAEAAEESVIV